MRNVIRTVAVAMLALGALAAPAQAAEQQQDQQLQRAERTTVTLEVPDCEGCTFTLQHAYDDGEGQYPVWSSRTKTVRDGEVSFGVRRARTHGMSITMTAPWEQHTGFVTNVVMRYGGHDVGDHVGFREAKKQEKGSACYAGTDESELTLAITAREVRVRGVGGEGHATTAFVDDTAPWLKPMRAVNKGVLGSQDVNVCRG